MRILHVSYSRAGGIGNVVAELAKAQIASGHHVEWDFLTAGPLRAEFLQHPIETVKAGLDDSILKSGGFHGPISWVRSGGSLMRRVAQKMNRFDVVHLHGGTLDLHTIAKVESQARVVVSHHDMRLVTGACHQSLDCEGYKSKCSSCPALRSHFQGLAQRNRMESFPTHWRHTSPSGKFSTVISQSSALKEVNVSNVPNPLPTELKTFQPTGQNDEFLTITGSSSPSALRNLDTDTMGLLVNIALRNNLKLVSIGGNTYDSRYVENLGILTRSESFEVMSRSKICMTPTKHESFSTAGLETLYLGAYLLAPLDSPQGELAEDLRLRVDLSASDLPVMSENLKKANQAALLEQFDISVVVEKFNDVYLD